MRARVMQQKHGVLHTVQLSRHSTGLLWLTNRIATAAVTASCSYTNYLHALHHGLYICVSIIMSWYTQSIHDFLCPLLALQHPHLVIHIT